MNKWLSANKLSLNLDKTNAIKYITKNSPQYPLNIGHNDKYIKEAVNTKFLDYKLRIIYWKNHIDQLVPKLSGAYYAVRSMLHVSGTDTLKSIYFAQFQSFKFGIIFVCNLSDSKTLPCEYIFSLINFITHNKEHFQTSADVYCVNTRHKYYLIKPTAKFSCF
jgi:hypothetical protein